MRTNRHSLLLLGFKSSRWKFHPAHQNFLVSMQVRKPPVKPIPKAAILSPLDDESPVLLIGDIVEKPSAPPKTTFSCPSSAFPKPKKLSSFKSSVTSSAFISPPSSDSPHVSELISSLGLSFSREDAKKLEWTDNLEPSSTTCLDSLTWREKIISTRFDFGGQIIPPGTDLPTSLGLHHHDSIQDLPGYTLFDLRCFISSVFEPQVITGLNILYKIFENLSSFGGSFQDEFVSIFVASQFINLILYRITNNSTSVLSSAAHCLQSISNFCWKFPSLDSLLSTSLRVTIPLSEAQCSDRLRVFLSHDFEPKDIISPELVLIKYLGQNFVMMLPRIKELITKSDDVVFQSNLIATLITCVYHFPEISSNLIDLKFLDLILDRKIPTVLYWKLFLAISYSWPEFHDSEYFLSKINSNFLKFILNSEFSPLLSLSVSCALLDSKYLDEISAFTQDIFINLHQNPHNFHLLFPVRCLAVTTSHEEVLVGLMDELSRLISNVSKLIENSQINNNLYNFISALFWTCSTVLNRLEPGNNTAQNMFNEFLYLLLENQEIFASIIQDFPLVFSNLLKVVLSFNRIGFDFDWDLIESLISSVDESKFTSQISKWSDISVQIQLILCRKAFNRYSSLNYLPQILNILPLIPENEFPSQRSLLILCFNNVLSLQDSLVITDYLISRITDSSCFNQKMIGYHCLPSIKFDWFVKVVQDLSENELSLHLKFLAFLFKNFSVLVEKVSDFQPLLGCFNQIVELDSESRELYVELLTFLDQKHHEIFTDNFYSSMVSSFAETGDSYMGEIISQIIFPHHEILSSHISSLKNVFHLLPQSNFDCFSYSLSLQSLNILLKISEQYTSGMFGGWKRVSNFSRKFLAVHLSKSRVLGQIDWEFD
ncbi:hypothetical protein RCL1_001681 [Eukaryota sp. TZLM3-RCL]